MIKYKISLDKGIPKHKAKRYDYTCDMCGNNISGIKNCQTVIEYDSDNDTKVDEIGNRVPKLEADRIHYYVCSRRCANMYILSMI